MTCLTGCKVHRVLSSIDLQSAYYQVRLKPEDVPKTAFTTPMGLYEFRVLCFGLTNAPGTFQNIMNDVLRECYQQICRSTPGRHSSVQQKQG